VRWRIPEQWEVIDAEFFKEYYRRIIEYLTAFGVQERSIKNMVFMTALLFPFYWELFHVLPLPPYLRDLELGLLAQIYKEPESAVDAVMRLSEGDNGTEVGKDGIAIFGRIPDLEII